MTYMYVLLMITISTTLQEDTNTPINMLTLSKHWYGLGDSLLFTGLLKILPEQLQKKSGMMTSAAEIYAGQNWQITYVMNFNCMKLRPPGSVAMWLQKNPIVFLQKDYTHENAKYLFGQVGPIQGFMMLFYNNSIRISFVNPQQMNRDNLLFNSKVCKSNLDRDNSAKLRVKYTDGKVLGFYIVEHDREELCIQFNDINFMDKFHLSFSGSDDGAGCLAEVKELSLRSEVQHEIIAQKDKQIGDAQFAYFENLTPDERRQQFEAYQRNFRIYKEKSQILANELMKFSSMDPDDITKNTKNNIQQSINKIDNFLDVIELEAQQMQQYSNILEQEKQKGDNDAIEVIQKILNFLDQTEKIFEKVDKSTQYIFEAMENIGNKNELDDLNKRARQLQKSLRNTKITLGRTQQVLKPLEQLEKSKLKVIKKWVRDNSNKSEKYNQRKQKSYISDVLNARNIALLILGSFGGAILLGFGYMYYKIKKQIRHKRII